MNLSRRSICSALACVIFGCGGDDGDAGDADAGASAVERPTVDLARVPYDRLSEYGFFSGRMVEQSPAPGVVPYTVISPLWADNAGKGRFIVLPEGGQIEAVSDDEWRFPVGSVVIKSFYAARDRRDIEGTSELIETRLLIHEADGWSGHTYLWNDDHSEAVRKVAGKRIDLEYVDADGNPGMQQYIVPNTNQCKNCHEIDDENRTLGLVTRQMGVRLPDGSDQLDHLVAMGLFVAPPARESTLVYPAGDAPLERRARSYLDANCSHCHRPGGDGGRSGLVLLASETTPTKYGVCKSPVAAGPGAGGRTEDVAPGEPENSIMIYRMSSTDPEIKMPEIPNLVVDDFGVELISEWIRSLEGDCE